jgi:hypothetical protein
LFLISPESGTILADDPEAETTRVGSVYFRSPGVRNLVQRCGESIWKHVARCGRRKIDMHGKRRRGVVINHYMP